MARKARRQAIAESGYDLNRIRLSLDPRREWRQMLREVWRLQRDQFWVADMSERLEPSTGT
jgi:tricorn protease